MMKEFDKCNFCVGQYSDDACDWCEERMNYDPDPEKIIQKARERNLSVSDVIALIEYTE